MGKDYGGKFPGSGGFREDDVCRIAEPRSHYVGECCFFDGRGADRVIADAAASKVGEKEVSTRRRFKVAGRNGVYN